MWGWVKHCFNNYAAFTGRPVAGLASVYPVVWREEVTFSLAALGLAIWVLVLLCRAGDAGTNRYGDPAPTTPG
jgi:uncharacterized membrane protein YhaH (DUF805 family)